MVHQTAFSHERVGSGDETTKSNPKLEVKKAWNKATMGRSVRRYMLRNLFNISLLYSSLMLKPKHMVLQKIGVAQVLSCERVKSRYFVPWFKNVPGTKYITRSIVHEYLKLQ